MDGTVDVVESRDPEGLGLLLKARATGRLYRVRPARDPRQPRFWCVLVYRCQPGGMADPGERPWVGAGGMTRDELPEVFRTIRADVDAWLAQEQCLELRRWLLTPGAPAAPLGTGAVADRVSATAQGPAAAASSLHEAR